MKRSLKFYWDLTRLIRCERPITDDYMRFVSDSDEAILVRLEGETLIAFDGTNTGREWLENVMTAKSKYDIAYGFYNAAKEFYGNMSQFLDGGAVNTIGGYSRGGALAQAFAMMARADGYRVQVVSFGSPRVGGRDFCRLMRGIEHTRVVIKGDPVPMLPLPIRFKHYETKLVELERPEGVWRPSKIHLSYGEAL